MSPPGKMAALLRSLTSRLNGSSGEDLKPRTDGFSTARTFTALFPPTDPLVDGEECEHDCESCTIKYPRKFKIDEEDELFGQIKGWQRHVLVATGKTDWVRDVEDEKGSVMESLGKHAGEVQGGRLMISASNIPVPHLHGEGEEGPYGKDRPTRVLLLPAFQWVEGVTPNTVPEFIKGIINTAPTNTTPLPRPHQQIDPSTLPASISLKPCPHRTLILLCSQATRDARCGQSAPLLRKELERHLRPLGLYRDLDDERPGGVGIYFISHVGGHKYSANMLVYRRGDPRRSVQEQIGNGDAEKAGSNGNGVTGSAGGVGGEAGESAEAAQCIWLARIRPEDCENIVRYTVLQGKVVKPASQLRGGFDRGRGVVSW
jgi:hypothetical protein